MKISDYEKRSYKEKLARIKEYCQDSVEPEQEITPIVKDSEKEKALMIHTASLLREMFDGSPVNVDPLTEQPDPEMRLYEMNGIYFETKEALDSYCQKYEVSDTNTCVFDYIREIAGQKDVIRKTNRDGRSILYAAIDESGYEIYNYERSVYRGKFTWEFDYGSIRELYEPFRARGVTFEKDVYGQIDQHNQLLLEFCRSKKR